MIGRINKKERKIDAEMRLKTQKAIMQAINERKPRK